ncbi:MAG: uroporphyrinogen decarboxylase family protein [Acidobacteriota bacterium]
MNGRERVLATLEGKQTDRLACMPITMMFAADQIGVKYGSYATDFRVLAEAQIKTAECFGFDYVSAISDPAREAADFGAKVLYPEDQPPALIEDDALLAEKSTLLSLKPLDPRTGRRMTDRLEAVALLRQKTGNSLCVEGWVEGPCAEAADLRGINRLMLDFIDDPQFVRDLFAVVTENGIRFAKAQIEAGADLVGIGDAAASLVGPAIYNELVWPYEKQLVDGIHASGGRTRLHICGNTRGILKGMGRLGCSMVDVDFPVPFEEARRDMGPHQVLAGNLDPVRALRDGTPDSILAGLARCHAAAGPHYIVAVGCEIVRDTPAPHVEALVAYANRQPGRGVI